MSKKLFQLFALFTACLFIFSACSKDDDSTAPSGSRKVTYKIIGSSDVKIHTVAYYVDKSVITKTDINASTWTSDEVTVQNGYVTISANAIGTSSSSTLKAQILENGKVIKENAVSTGTTLTTNLSL